MEKFLVDPYDCLILKAFRDTRSLRDAALRLGCDPAGLARRVKVISSQHGFMQKVDNRWHLTARGLDLVVWAEASIESQKKALSSKSGIRLASTMWFSEEVLIPGCARFRKTIEEEATLHLSVPTKAFERCLVDGSVDFVVVCHPPEIPEIEHKRIAEEEWVLVAPRSWRNDIRSKGAKALDYLKGKPFIRHSGMNRDLFVPGLPELLEADISTDNLIGVRSAVREGLGWSLVPRLLVNRHLREGGLILVPLDVPVRDRSVCVWWLRSRNESRRRAGRLSAWVKEACTLLH